MTSRATRSPRRPVADLFASRNLGPISIASLVVGYVLLWLVARPEREPWAAYL